MVLFNLELADSTPIAWLRSPGSPCLHFPGLGSLALLKHPPSLLGDELSLAKTIAQWPRLVFALRLVEGGLS